MDQLDTRGSPPIREHYSLWRGVRVTDAFLVVGERAYQIRELRRLRVQRGSMQTTLRAVVAVVLVETVVAAVALAGVVSAAGPSAAAYVFGGAHALASTVLIGLAWLRWPTPDELWAEYRGQFIRLYGTPDQFELGKVRRAVERAMVAHRLLK
jgi:Family of unknown function (DUF6232)